MKKLLVACIAVAFVFGLVAQTAVAEERLSLNGSVRVRAWSKTDYDFDSDADNNQQYWDQRFRLGAVIAPADGVKAVLRCDFADDTWGKTPAGVEDMTEAQYYDAIDSVQGSAVQTDKAYMDISKGMLHLTAGLQSFALGNAVAVDAQATGLIATIKTPLTITLAYIKVVEDPTLGANKTDEDGYEDVDAYALNLGYHTDAFTINGFYATAIDSQDDGLTMNVIGVQGIFNIGPVNVNAELNIFGGDDGADTDFVGTQFWAVASMNMSDALTLGGLVVYSNGEEEDDQEKITYLSDDGSTVYTDLGAFNTLGISAVPGDDIFDPTNENTGAMGLAVFVEFKPIETLTLNGNVGYLTAVEEMDYDGEFESATLLNISAKWAFTQAASLALHYHYLSVTLADDVDADPASGLGLKLQIDF